MWLAFGVAISTSLSIERMGIYNFGTRGDFIIMVLQHHGRVGAFFAFLFFSGFWSDFVLPFFVQRGADPVF